MKKKTQKPKKLGSKSVSKSTIGIKPLQDRILIKEIKEEATKTKSGIIIPDSASENKETKTGKVIAVGPGRTENGKVVPMSVSPGDVVIYSWGEKLNFENEEYIVIRESDIAGIIK